MREAEWLSCAFLLRDIVVTDFAELGEHVEWTHVRSQKESSDLALSHYYSPCLPVDRWVVFWRSISHTPESHDT